MIFEVKCDERTKNEERTNGPDAHTYCLFYSIRLWRVHFKVAEVVRLLFKLKQFWMQKLTLYSKFNQLRNNMIWIPSRLLFKVLWIDFQTFSPTLFCRTAFPQNLSFYHLKAARMSLSDQLSDTGSLLKRRNIEFQDVARDTLLVLTLSCLIHDIYDILLRKFPQMSDKKPPTTEWM